MVSDFPRGTPDYYVENTEPQLVQIEDARPCDGRVDPCDPAVNPS
jgi:hypothetical protein